MNRIMRIILMGSVLLGWAAAAAQPPLLDRWFLCDGISTETTVDVIVSDPADPRTVLAKGPTGAWTSSDGGLTYTPKQQWYPPSEFMDLTYVSGQTDTLLGAGEDGIYYSQDDGDTWSRCSEGLPADPGQGYTTMVVQDPVLPLAAWATVPNADDTGAVYRGDLSGLPDSEPTWWPTSPLPGDCAFPYSLSTAIGQDPSPHTVLYAGTSGGGIFMSSNDGLVWEQAGLGPQLGGWITHVEVDPGEPDSLYAVNGDGSPGGQDTFFVSQDGGSNWWGVSVMNTGSRVADASVEWCVVPNGDRFAPGPVTVAQEDGRVWRSEDGGSTWQEWSEGLPLIRSDFRAHALAPNPGKVLMGTSDGVYCRVTGCILSVCSATADPVSGEVPLRVTFAGEAEAVSCASGPGFFWDFGDGETSAEQNPEHSYREVGGYTWTLSITAEERNCTLTGSILVAHPSRPGDCDGGGTVSIGEVQGGINMFLGLAEPACNVDQNADGTVSIGEVQAVINAFLEP